MCTRITSFKIMNDDSLVFHTRIVVLRARNLISKGKGGNNDVFVTIQLGKEKYQTSTIKNARNPEWFEECDLPIPHLHSEIEVTVYHRAVLSDDFLGYASIALWEQKIQDSPKTQWIPLKCRPGKSGDTKYRGEVEVKVTFHCHNRTEFTTGGLKKRSSSIRNLATAVGDKFRLTRSKSFRENRKDPEGGKTDRNQNHNQSLQDVPEDGQLTRSYSMSAAYIRSMTLDRGRVMQYPKNGEDSVDMRTQSMYNIPGNRHSMVELPSSQAPPPYRPSSQDDMHLVQRPGSAPARPFPHQPYPAMSAPYLDSGVHSRRDLRHARYESIRERTEPESSSDDENDDPPPRPRPPPRGLRTRPRPLSADVNIDPKDLSALALVPHSRAGAAVGAGSREGTHTTDSGEAAGRVGEMQRSETITNGSLRRHSGTAGGGGGGGVVPSLLNGDIKMRKRSKRERLKMYRQGGRRFTIQGNEIRSVGLYDDSLSDPSDSPRTEIPEDLFSIYQNMSREELLHLVIKNKAQIIRKDQYIKDLESYIDNLLVRVMEAQPRILTRPPTHLR